MTNRHKVCNVTVTNTGKFGKQLDLERMLRAFKKKCEKLDLLHELRSHTYYVSPSMKRRLKDKEARRRMERENEKRQAYLSKADK